MSGQPWSSPSGDPLAAGPRPPRPASAPPTFQPGYASLPQPEAPPASYPPTTQFPATGYPATGYPPPEYSAAPQYAAAPQYGQPPGYPPEGMPPGYPPGGMPPAGMPPGPPPRKSNAPLIALILAVVVLLCGGAVTAGVLVVNQVTDRAKEAIKPITDPTFPTVPTEIPDLPTGVPGLPGGPARKITVGYEVTGDGPVDILYTEKLGEAPQRISNAKLPWKLTTTMEGAALVSVTAIRSGTDTGTVSCRATVDGEEVAQRTREGTFATVSCIKMVID